MKKILSLLLAVMLITACFAVPVMAEEDTAISVLLDGEYVAFDVAPTIVDGRTMVPLRAIFEALGATVDWQQETQTVVSIKGDTDITLKINGTTLYKNGEAITLDVPAQLVENRTLVPVRAISEAYGCYVDWNNWTKTVLIVSDLDAVSVATVNGEPVSMGYYNYVLTEIGSNAMNSMGLQPDEYKNSWNSDVGGITFGNYIVGAVLEQCVYTKSNAQKAKAAGIELTDEDKQAVDAVVKTLLSVYDEEIAVGAKDEYLKANGLTLTALMEFYTDNCYVKKYADMLIGDSASDDNAIKYLDENYVKAKHILISTMDMETGMPLPDEEIAAKKKLAEQILVKIRNGSNFDKLITEFGEDPGMEQNPGGYLFTDGEMVEEFETAVKNLKVGEISGIVESAYGFHIIKRVANGTYTKQEIEQVKSIIVQSVQNVLNSNLQESSVTTKDAILLQVVPTGI